MTGKFLTSRLQKIHKSSIRKIFDAAPPDAINMGLGELQFPTPQPIRDYAEEILKGKYIPYTPNAGDPELRNSIGQYYNSKVLEPCVTVGAEEALFLAIMAYAEKGDEVMIPDPEFVAYRSMVHIAEATPVAFDLLSKNNFRIDLEDLSRKITSKTKMIILSNPSNPLGTCLNKEEIEFLLAICEKKGIILLVDEIYRELFHDNRPASLAGRNDFTLVVSGLSKSHCMTGWRLGWIIGNSQLIDPLIPLHQYICTCAPYLSQKAGIFALSDPGMQENEKIRNLLNSNFLFLRRKLFDKVESFSMVNPVASPYIFFQTDEPEEIVLKKLISAGIIALPGSIFGQNSINWIRLSYGLPQAVLELAVKRIISVLNN